MESVMGVGCNLGSESQMNRLEVERKKEKNCVGFTLYSMVLIARAACALDEADGLRLKGVVAVYAKGLPATLPPSIPSSLLRPPL